MVAQPGPTVGAIDELVGESQPQLWVLPQVGDLADTELGGALAAHADDVGVVEAERFADADAIAGESGGEGGVIGELAAGVDLGAQGAGVLGVEIDVAVDERVEDDPGAPHLGAVSHLGEALREGQPRDLTEDHRLGELLRRQRRWLRLGATARPQQQAAEEGVAYSTSFIGTRAGHDSTSTAIEIDGVAVTRKYSDEVGVVLATVEGSEASYTFSGDELYVRAKVVSSKLKANPYQENEKEVAWVQPVLVQSF